MPLAAVRNEVCHSTPQDGDVGQGDRLRRCEAANDNVQGYKNGTATDATASYRAGVSDRRGSVRSSSSIAPAGGCAAAKAS
jgi:hypothetical protein